MNSALFESKLINDTFESIFFPFNYVTDISELGTFSVKKVIEMFSSALKLAKLLFQKKPDLVYFTLAPSGYAFYRDTFFVVIIKLFRKKLIYHLHGKGIKAISNKNFFTNFLCRFIFKNTDVICLSKLITSDIETIYSKKPFIVANGINLLSEDYADRNIQKIKTPTIVFLSNFHKTKGILDLVNALEHLAKKNVAFKIIFIGSPSALISNDKLEKYIKDKGLLARTKILGPKYDDEKNKALKSADILAFPTYNDAFPLVILEAMQLGLPVISTFEGSISEIVDDGVTGFLVKQRDIYDLADKLEVLIKDKTLRVKMGNAGRKKFREKYTLDIFEKNMKLVFDKTLSG